MKTFMDRDFLLTTETARRLFHEYAEHCPIVDYHNHLPAREIFERHEYQNLCQLWLAADHYRWSAMRLCGVEERLITGNASEYEKYRAYARIMPMLIGHPVYHWTHMELQRYFGIDTPLTDATADEIWNITCAMLQDGGFDAVSLLQRMDVRVVCTTDDPADTLEWHEKCKADPELPFAVYPSFRPDRFMNIDKPQWRAALESLHADSWQSLLDALHASLDRFCALGCRSSDHGFTRLRYAKGDPEAVMNRALAGEALSEEEIAVYQGGLLRFLAGEYTRRGMVMQLHIGAMRNNSPKLFASLGADCGGDSIAATTDPFVLAGLLGDLEAADSLPRTVLYSLNSGDHGMMTTMALTFASGGARVRYGAAWWFQDQLKGMNEHLDYLLQSGTLPGFPGMLTDSRSFTSFVRHEYFRRILCEKLGGIVERGEYPDDSDALGELVERLCWKNTNEFFGFHIAG